MGVVRRAVIWGKGKKKIFLEKIFWKKYFWQKYFQQKYFWHKYIFFLPLPHLTALQTTPLLSSSSVIFEVECDKRNELTVHEGREI